MISKKRKFAIGCNIFFLIFTLIFIFGNSFRAGVDSSEESQKILLLLSKLFHSLCGSSPLTHHLVRKLAHFTEFFVLGFLIINLLYLCRKNNLHLILHGLFFGLFCALSDETIQVFNDRNAQVMDIWIDFSGVVCGFLWFLLLYALYSFRKSHRHNHS